MSKENLLPISLNPSWVEKYSTGKIDMTTKKISEYNNNKFEYQQSISNVGKILEEGNNSSVKPLLINDKKIPPTEPLNEQFTCYMSNINFFSNIKKRTNIWVLIIFLIIIWIIYFIAN